MLGQRAAVALWRRRFWLCLLRGWLGRLDRGRRLGQGLFQVLPCPCAYRYSRRQRPRINLCVDPYGRGVGQRDLDQTGRSAVASTWAAKPGALLVWVPGLGATLTRANARTLVSPRCVPPSLELARADAVLARDFGRRCAGARLWAAIVCFCSIVHRRRRSPRVINSIRDIGALLRLAGMSGLCRRRHFSTGMASVSMTQTQHTSGRQCQLGRARRL